MSNKKSAPPQQEVRRNTSDKKTQFEILKTGFVDSMYDRYLNTSTDGGFKAVCLSGLRTEDNTGVSLDKYDAIERDGYLEITVRPLDPTLSQTLPNPAGSKNLDELICSLGCHTSVFTAKSDFEIGNTNPPKFGQIINCYFEEGSIRNSNFSGLRFSRVEGREEFHPDYKSLTTLNTEATAKNAFDTNTPALLGGDEFVGPPNLYARPATPSEKLSQQQKLDSLDPRMKPKIEKVLKSLKDQGFQPKIYFAWRSLIEQKEIVEKGNSKVYFSFHTAYKDGKPNAYAVDIIDKRWAWTPAAETNGFWTALGKAGKKEKLYWGGDWKDFPDWAHLQFYDNNKLRQVCTESGLPTDFQIRVKK